MLPELDGFLIPSLRHLRFATWIVALAACAPPPAASGPLELRDDAGMVVRLPGPATRVASLIPATTEWLFALGAGELVVGRTTWCDYPLEASAVANLGDGIQPSLEAILAVQPDLVLLYHSPSNSTAAERLAALGIPTLQLRTDNLADLDRLLAVLGRAVGREAEARRLQADIRNELADASVALGAGAPSLFVLAWDQPPMTLGRGSFLSEIIERAGARNLFGDLELPSATISIEAVVRRDPDFILITSTDSIPAVARRPEWRVVPAVRDGRFIRVTGSQFNRPGPRTPAAIRAMRRALAEAAP
jgi:ABC-type Fe3+-hydroxamate transport system substrate-binding protein